MTHEKPDLTQLLERLRAGAAFDFPQVAEIKPEIRSAGIWNPPARESPLLMEVRYNIYPDRTAQWLDTLRRFEPRLIELTRGSQSEYIRTYVTFAGVNDIITHWNITDTAAIVALSRTDDELGQMLQELQSFVDRSDPSRFQVTLRVPAADSFFLGPVSGRSGRTPRKKK